MMSQFVATKNPPWVRATAAGLVQPPPAGSSIITAQQISHASAAGTGLAGAGLGPGAGLAPATGLAGTGLTAGGANSLATAAAVVAAAQNQQAQQAPAVSASYGTGLAAITLTQSALQQGAMLQQQGIAIPASLAATTQVANVNNGMVVEIARLPQPGVALPTSLATTQVATVSYPAPRLLAQTTQYQGPQPHPHQTAVVQQAAAAVVQQHPAPQQPQQQAQQYKHRVFTGTVTKLHENFGFVDEDVFFQMSAVKGNIPKAGERVLVEASYNSNSPFKWNATRIQVLPNQVISNQVVQLNVPQGNNNRPAIGQQGPLTAVVAAPVSLGINVSQNVNMNAAIANVANNQAGFTTVAQPGRWQVQQEMAVIETLGQQQQQQRLAIQHNNQHPWVQEVDFGELMDNKGPRMSNVVRRHSPPSRRERERDREVRRDDRRDRYRERERYSPPPRKRSRSPRRSSRSPPRRRQRTVPRYTVQIPKISLDLKTGNVMELRKRYSNLYIPSDFCAASFLWQDVFPLHRPFVMDHPCNFHIVGKDTEPILENDAVLEPPDADYTYSAKVMLMSIPSLNEIFKKSCALAQDGDDAKENFVHPTRLISFLVGLKGKNETVAIGGPWSPSLDGPNPEKDPATLVKTAIRTCKALTGIDLSKCSQWYRFAEIYYRRGESSSHKGRGMRVETVVLFVPDVWSCLPTRVEWDGMIATGCCKKPLQPKLPEETSDLEAQEEEEGAPEAEKKEPTHFSELDPKTIKVNDLKRELEARNLSVKGLKSQLIARLTKALKTESEKESEEKLAELKQENVEENTDGNGEDDKKKEKEEDKKSKDEKEKVGGEKINFPDSPAVIVQPSRTAKNGKFDCAVMSLSLLLDYRQEDNKEHSFEVSLFAEIFNEMMMRDFGFRIYRGLVEAPEIKDDEKDKKKGDKKEDKKDRKDEKDDNRRRDDSNEHESEKDDDESEEDECDDDKREKKKRRKKKLQMITYDPYLLLSFVYFDQTHCGYILDKDIEEIFYTLGLMLSRAQARKLIQKVCKREIFHYRKLTDRPVDSDKICKADVSKINIEDLAIGNKKYIPSLKHVPMDNCNSVKKENGSNSSLISYQGALVDVGKLMEQIERSEKARLNTDESVKELQIQLENVNEATSNKEKLSQKLSQEIEELKQKLHATEEELRRTQIESEKYHKTLCSLKEGLQSSLFLTDNALNKSKSSRLRSFRESDNYNMCYDSNNKSDRKSRDTEKEMNGDDAVGSVANHKQEAMEEE
ncbi:cell division cycle and apoptosis regulator protein 1-like [Argiope bruennichi]|uniref:Cell division cycle and apoptosis regulator like protein n=1 Tax=Argiope bruennichi TaxID=94029 RepID=A0A8T0EVB5_ARGBR|nr:cell division cycle and apoptosis regulator protein 1-like [Argiope bruennichi]KAF8781684.1 Cell division cycle and apoptosis regulator like protein [Argiope bruennichi]